MITHLPEEGEEHQAVLPQAGHITLTMLVRGKRPVSHLVAALSDIDGVREVGRIERGVELE